MKGWVYIITNVAMPNLLKIGYSDRDPENRAIELNSTASPHPHIVEFAVLVEQPRKVEKAVHMELKDFHEGKEWFKCDTSKGKSAILDVANDPVITHQIASTPNIKPEVKYCTVCGIKPKWGEIFETRNFLKERFCPSCFKNSKWYELNK